MGRTQTLVQLTDELLAALDEYVASSGRSRSDVIRDAVERHLAEIINREIDRQIVEGYRRIPQEADPWAEAIARESIGSEPW